MAPGQRSGSFLCVHGRRFHVARVASDFYDFVSGRHGKAMDEASRLDCFSDFRMELALDVRIYPALKDDMERRIWWLAVNPLGSAPEREMQDAFARYKLLQAEAENGRLLGRIEQERRFGLSSFGESEKASAAKSMLHVATFGGINSKPRVKTSLQLTPVWESVTCGKLQPSLRGCPSSC